MNLQEFNLSKVEEYIKNNDKNGLVEYISKFGLEIKNNKIQPSVSYIKQWNELHEFYDKRQLVKKIVLNSCYGAILNRHMRFYDLRIGQSVTLSGRQIVKHMGSKLNELITGEYDITGKAVIYGDSVTGDSIIRTSDGDMTIADLYKNCLNHSIVGEKEYGLWNETKVLGFNADQMEPSAYSINYVMRHKTKKKLYRVTTKNGKQVTVTEDHSLIVDRDGFLIEVKPSEIKDNDLIITFSPK